MDTGVGSAYVLYSATFHIVFDVIVGETYDSLVDRVHDTSHMATQDLVREALAQLMEES